MKRLVLLMLFAISSVAFGANVKFSQDELLTKLKPILKESQTYEKFKEINAKSAQGGELIKTITTDGLETQNTAKEGDYIVRNTTDAKEMYIIKKAKFEKRYEYKGDIDETWKLYKAVGKIKGIRINDEFLKSFDLEDEFYFMAPWGEEMVVKKGDFLVSPLDYLEVYRIAEKEFFETYKESK